MSEIEELKKRVAELEAEVARLKSQPAHVVHSHYHYGQPILAGGPAWTPHWQQPTWGAAWGGGLGGKGEAV